MADAIGQILAYGVGVAISPIPIIGVILMLATPRGRSNGIGFIVGWVAGLTVVGGLVLILSSGSATGDSGEPEQWVSVLHIALGVLLLLVAVRQWRGRPAAGQEPEMPAWMKSIDRFTVGRATTFGVLLSAVNPKNLLLVVGAATAITQTNASSGSQAVALAVFVIIGSIGTGAPLVIYFSMGERSKSVLEAMKTRMSSNNAVIMAVLCLVIGAKLIGDGLGGV